jgi:predicted MFS family arabinose efflux permease
VTTTHPRRRRLTGPLRHRNFRLLWAGSTASALGDAVVQIALLFAILHIGGTASDIGVVLAVKTVAQVGCLLAGGVWADRLRRQYVMLTADAVRGVVQTVLAVLLLSGHAHIWELCVAEALYGAATSFFSPASTALVPEAVPDDQLQQANSLLGLPASFFSVGGPAVGGVLIAVFGPGWLFAADAASFFVSLGCLAQLRVPPRPLPAVRPFLTDLAEGWHELAARPWYSVNLLAHACGNFVVPALFVIGPVIAARSLGGATAWGVLSAAWGAGAVVGGLVGLRVKPRRPLVTADLLMAGVGLPLLALAFSRSVALIAVAEAAFGLTMIMGNSVWFTAMQVLIPDRVRARVGAYDLFISLAIMPAGWLVMGPVAALIGNTVTLAAAAALGSVPCVLVTLVPRVRAVHRTAGGDIAV